MYLNSVQKNPRYIQAPLRDYDYIHIMFNRILNNDLYYVLALAGLAIMAFAVGMAVGLVVILCI